MQIELAKLVMHVIIVALSTLGIVEWAKAFFKNAPSRVYAILGLVVLSVCVTMQLAPDPVHTSWFNMFVLGVAAMQFGHAALIKLPEKLTDKFIGGK